MKVTYKAAAKINLMLDIIATLPNGYHSLFMVMQSVDLFDRITAQIKANHVDRLQKGDCTIELGFVLSDLLSNFERISDHCSNIAVYTMQLPTDALDAHKYLNKIKTSSTGVFVENYNMYSQKYKLD